MKISVIAAAAGLCLCLAGCTHTEQGLRQDTQQNEPKVAHAVRQASHEAALATQKAANGLSKEAGKAAQRTNKDGKDNSSTKS